LLYSKRSSRHVEGTRHRNLCQLIYFDVDLDCVGDIAVGAFTLVCLLTLRLSNLENFFPPMDRGYVGKVHTEKLAG